MPEVNIWAALASGAASLVLGGLWYSPVLFAKSWQRFAGITEQQEADGNLAMTFGLTFLLSAAAAYVFGMFIGPDMDLGAAVGAGFAAGLFWVGASFGINYLFERRPLGLWLVNGGYHTVQFTLFGLIFGLMI